ncbi:MAG: Phosphoglycerate kinase [Candidatus Peribacteria bacterium]|nr:Phosphoglycerate kinase [Candidatus Peribacteria bacterium]
MSYSVLTKADLRGKRVLLRAGFDVKMENGVVMEVERIEALVPTMLHILTDASLIILSHQGRPQGKPVPEYSQKPLVPELERLLGRPVQFAPSCVGPEAKEKANALQPGEVLLLENLRYEPGEEANDPVFAAELAALGDVYVNDAFTNCHRAHASMVGLPALLPAYAGLQLDKELSHLSRAVHDPVRPLVLIISGAKMETKIPVIERFLSTGDDILLGGCIANTFIAAEGHSIGTSRHEDDQLETAKELLEASNKVDMASIHVPKSVVIAAHSNDADSHEVASHAVPADMSIFDIGAGTVEAYAQVLEKAGTIVWNGPMGLYETEQFSAGTRGIATAVAKATARGAISLVGGGDTIDFHVRYGFPMAAYTFVSTGGGAMLEYISGKSLPALQALEQ